MMTVLAPTRVPLNLRGSIAGALIAAGAIGGIATLQGQTTNYTVYSPEGRRTLAIRAGSPETFALEQLAGQFGLTFNEDRSANGLVIGTRKDRIVAVPGQSFIQVAGRVVGLDAPIRRERTGWIAPVDFLTKALGPAIGEPVVIRRTSRLVLIGNVRVPQISGRVEKTSTGARVVLTIQPATPHRVQREGNRLTVRFDAAALDAAAITGLIPEFVPGARIDGTAVVIDLGPQASMYRAEDDRTREILTIELLPPVPVGVQPLPLPAGKPLSAAPPAQIDLAPGIRTIVLDPGHGGEDAGVRSAGGALEKDVTLLIARRLKTAIETRLGMRVLLTRDADENVTIDRRTEFANHNNADLFLSLHANASVRPATRGAQLYALDAADYPSALPPAEARRRTVPLLGGGSRIIDPMPWELAQLPYAEQSAMFSSFLVQRLTEKAVALHARASILAPMRVLAGANMPAVLIECGFLTNAQDEVVLTSAEGQSTLIEAVLAAIGDVRQGFPAPEGRRRP
jgi:N-acetylmuramoyl-L-alanine amidase